MQPQHVQFTSGSLFIRPIRTSDVSTAATLLSSTFYGQDGWFRWLVPIFQLGIAQDLHLRCIAPPPRSVCLVAIGKDRRVVGMVELSSRYLDVWSTKPLLVLYVSNLAVTSALRRQGIGSQLLMACEPIAKSWGFQELFLHVKDENQVARGLYQKLGYRLHRLELPLWAALLGQSQHLLLRKSIE